MSKYNANGGQRRSAKAKLVIPPCPTIQCRICKTFESRLATEKLRKWEMQHMHFEEGELEFMTCPKCKILGPMEMLRIVGLPTDKEPAK